MHIKALVSSGIILSIIYFGACYFEDRDLYLQAKATIPKDFLERRSEIDNKK
jgi:hypothetical protein